MENKTEIQSGAEPINPTYFKDHEIDCSGLSKREYFAGKALQGLCANYLRDNVQGWNIKSYAAEAVELADELLKQLEQK